MLKVPVCRKCWDEAIQEQHDRNEEKIKEKRVVPPQLSRRALESQQAERGLQAEAEYKIMSGAEKAFLASNPAVYASTVDNESKVDPAYFDEWVDAGIMGCPKFWGAELALRHTHVGLPPPRCCPFDKRVLHLEKKNE